MHGRARSRRQEEPERTAPGGGTARPAAADAVLELQRGAGNHAVSALLARETKEKPKEEAATGTRAMLPGIGTIPLLSVQLGGSHRRTRGREEGENEQAGGEIVLTSRVGKHSQALLKAALDGKAMDVEVVIAGDEGSLRIQLKGAMVSSYTTSDGGEGGGTESWTLNFRSIEQEVKQGESE